jgi:hypothetical protein
MIWSSRSSGTDSVARYPAPISASRRLLWYALASLPPLVGRCRPSSQEGSYSQAAFQGRFWWMLLVIALGGQADPGTLRSNGLVRNSRRPLRRLHPLTLQLRSFGHPDVWTTTSCGVTLTHEFRWRELSSSQVTTCQLTPTGIDAVRCGGTGRERRILAAADPRPHLTEWGEDRREDASGRRRNSSQQSLASGTDRVVQWLTRLQQPT